MKLSYRNKKSKLLTPTLNAQFELRDESYLVSHDQYLSLLSKIWYIDWCPSNKNTFPSTELKIKLHLKLRMGIIINFDTQNYEVI